mgnify:CR=1 FL=1
MKRFLLFFVLILGFVSATFAQTGTVPEVDYSAMITTFAGFVGGVVLLTEGIKALFPKMQGLATQIVSWCRGSLWPPCFYGGWMRALSLMPRGISRCVMGSVRPLCPMVLPIRALSSGSSDCLRVRMSANRL